MKTLRGKTVVTNNRVIICKHKDFEHLNIEIDFGDLWDGARDEKEGNAGVSWGGGFKGRPMLADQLIKDHVQNSV